MGWGQMNLTQAFGDGGIVAAVDGHVGLLTISNARRKNALNLAMWQGVAEATNWLASQDARAIILQGDGGVDFSAGADISEFDEVRKDTASALAYETANSAAFAALREAPVPVIAKSAASASAAGWGWRQPPTSASATKPAASPFLPASWVWPIRRMRWPILWRRSVRRLQGLPCSRHVSFRRRSCGLRLSDDAGGKRSAG